MKYPVFAKYLVHRGSNFRLFSSCFQDAIDIEYLNVRGTVYIEYPHPHPEAQISSRFALRWLVSSALCYSTAELLSSRGRPPSVRPSIKPVFLEPQCTQGTFDT